MGRDETTHSLDYCITHAQGLARAIPLVRVVSVRKFLRSSRRIFSSIPSLLWSLIDFKIFGKTLGCSRVSNQQVAKQIIIGNKEFTLRQRKHRQFRKKQLAHSGEKRKKANRQRYIKCKHAAGAKRKERTKTCSICQTNCSKLIKKSNPSEARARKAEGGDYARSSSVLLISINPISSSDHRVGEILTCTPRDTVVSWIFIETGDHEMCVYSYNPVSFSLRLSSYPRMSFILDEIKFNVVGVGISN